MQRLLLMVVSKASHHSLTTLKQWSSSTTKTATFSFLQMQEHLQRHCSDSKRVSSHITNKTLDYLFNEALTNWLRSPIWCLWACQLSTPRAKKREWLPKTSSKCRLGKSLITARCRWSFRSMTLTMCSRWGVSSTQSCHPISCSYPAITT